MARIFVYQFIMKIFHTFYKLIYKLTIGEITNRFHAMIQVDAMHTTSSKAHSFFIRSNEFSSSSTVQFLLTVHLC